MEGGVGGEEARARGDRGTLTPALSQRERERGFDSQPDRAAEPLAITAKRRADAVGGRVVGIDIDNAGNKIDLGRVLFSKVPGALETEAA